MTTTGDPNTGIRTFPVAPNLPIYGAAYIQDKFTFKDIIFRPTCVSTAMTPTPRCVERQLLSV